MNPPLSLLHTTGIAAAATNNLLVNRLAPQRAYPLLVTALGDLDAAPGPLTGLERQRRIGILYKLGEISEKLERDDETEKFLSRAVTESLRAVVEARREVAAGIKAGTTKEADVTDDMMLPNWLSKTDVAASCEALGSFYMRKEKPE